MIAISLLSDRRAQVAWLALNLLLASVLPAVGGMMLRGMGHAPSTYVDFCSTPNVNCAIALSIEQRLVATAPATAYVLTRFSDSATQNIGYVGPTFKADTATAISFCTGNGGTTTNFTATPNYTQYNDCGISQINDQTANGCNPSQATQTHMAPFDVRSDGKPASIVNAQGGGESAPGSKWLSASGCTAPCPGAAARSAIIRSNNLAFSNCCGTLGGCAENTFSVVSGSMYVPAYYHAGAVTNFGADVEGGGGCVSNTPINFTPEADGVGLIAYSGTNTTNTYYNNALIGPANCTPAKTINSQTRFLIGTSGDGTSSGPLYWRSEVFTTDDVSATAGLPTQIYNYLAAL